MKIDECWSFKEAIDKIVAIKQEYLGVLSLFSCFEIKKKRQYIIDTKKDIYSIRIKDWQKDKLWEFMNDDLDFKVLNTLVNGQKS